MTRTLSARLLAAVVGACAASAFAQGVAPTSAEVARFFQAVQLDDAATVRKLLVATVNPNQVNPVGGEPGLVMALREGSMKVFDVLLAQPGLKLEAPALNGNTALMMAAYQHNARAIDTLLARGAAIAQTGWTALHYAAAAGDDAIVAKLLQRGAPVDATSPRASGAFTPLMMAAREGHDRTVQLLLKAGAQASLRNAEGLDAAQIAERADKPDIAATIRANLAASGG
ncbi:ankyrin repeat domain-containing protein [Massilia sp. S19_KUP03_FR1]|uniref:ankyrin repeat domain-containing protein n=1 Tax=Massilia sp. S19_KUP03_FR1 TaxID=3025503 RepID=UPI002FCDA79D